MGIKIGFFDSTEYVGVVECSLKPLPSEIISFIDIFLEIKIFKNVNKWNFSVWDGLEEFNLKRTPSPIVFSGIEYPYFDAHIIFCDFFSKNN